MKARTRKRTNLVLGWVYLAIVGPLGIYVLFFEPDLWDHYSVFAVLAISVETAAFTHFAAAAADTPTEGED